MAGHQVSKIEDWLMIPRADSEFPARCVATNRTDDLVYVDSDLRSIGLSKAEQGALDWLVVICLALAGKSFWHVGKAEQKATYPVNRDHYESWKRQIQRKKKITIALVGGGGLAFVGSLIFLIATGARPMYGIVGNVVSTLVVVAFIYGFFGPLIGAFYGFFSMRPILNKGILGDANHWAARGAAPEYLQTLPDYDGDFDPRKASTWYL